jgi:lysozyme
MKMNEAGLETIKKYESCRLKAYPDPASPLAEELSKDPNQRRKGWESLSGAPWTVGWGSTGVNDFAEPPVPIGPTTIWTQEQADDRLCRDVERFAIGVASLVKVNLSSNQFSALVSFAYNVGLGNLKSSTLLQLVNRGRYALAADEFLRWNKAKGKVLLGLTRRRESERRLFLTP